MAVGKTGNAMIDKIKNIIQFSSIVFIIATLPQNVWSCTPADHNFRCETLEEKIEKSDYVFKAKFIGFGIKFQKNKLPNLSRIGRYKIVKVWKGTDINVGNVIIAAASDRIPICPESAPLAEFSSSYYFYAQRCQENCVARNQFFGKSNCESIKQMRHNIDDEVLLEQQINKIFQQN